MQRMKIDQPNNTDSEYRFRKKEQVSCGSEVDGSEKTQ